MAVSTIKTPHRVYEYTNTTNENGIMALGNVPATMKVVSVENTGGNLLLPYLRLSVWYVKVLNHPDMVPIKNTSVTVTAYCI